MDTSIVIRVPHFKNTSYLIQILISLDGFENGSPNFIIL